MRLLFFRMSTIFIKQERIETLKCSYFVEMNAKATFTHASLIPKLSPLIVERISIKGY